MNDDTVRVGLVSSVNQDTGMVRVTYPDRDPGGDAGAAVF